MLPATDVLPDVLPTDRLTANGRPVPEVRAELRRISNVGNAFTVVSCWAWIIGPIWLAAAVGHPLLWVAAFLLVGRSFARLNILGHEAAHRLLFTNKTWNDRIGRWLLAHPAFTPLDAYRRAHMAHHKDEMGPEEPDRALYAGYPITKDSMRRKLVRDAVGISGWKNLKGLLRGIRARNPIALKILAAQAMVFAGFLAWGRPELYLLLWVAPWMTVWRVLNRLRAIAEHGGMTRSDDRRLTTHHVRQSPAARFWMVPYNTGWHLAHHVDIGIPWRNLPRLHDELVASGWVTPDLEYPSYLALWRQLASRPTAGQS